MTGPVINRVTDPVTDPVTDLTGPDGIRAARRTTLRRTTLRRATVALTLAAASVGLAGCAGDAGASGGTDVGATRLGSATPVPSASTATSGASTVATTSAPATADPRAAKVTAANTALTTSLYTLVEAMKKVQTDNTLSDLRGQLGTAATGARDALARERKAAYPSETRSCTSVRTYASRVAGFVETGTRVRGSIASRIGLLESDLAALKTAQDAVTTRRDALAAALKGVSNPPSTVSPADVTAALEQATTRRSDVAGTIATVGVASSEARTAFAKNLSSSRTILYDAC
ncbi:hypothetical protein [Terracoccus luteus]|uniref:Uncharacterized protein n=1 Tax=Terracoccus luteus TaxID=53356 RepID=A0A839PN29_9MICO|nr:hypothetical protein [Terracoccus luteus]MBB2985698.1 hypothetical protein [Terracoccus luteus]MCP2171350.1 hypothetical protein [Terracoccus luteus]